VISVRDLHYTYGSSPSEAVRGIEFAVADGEIFGFLGPSGAGKSTVQKILTGLLRDFSGEAHVLDTDMRRVPAAFYERIGVSFELPNLYLRLSGRENLELAAALYRRRALSPRMLLDVVGLAEASEMRVAAYSKGMRMRLNFARAFVGDPELLFLDEPTSGLDPGNGQLIKRSIREAQAAGRTVFLTTHDMHVAAELCDRVAFIVDGTLVLIDSPKSLAAREGRRSVRVEYTKESPAPGGAGRARTGGAGRARTGGSGSPAPGGPDSTAAEAPSQVAEFDLDGFWKDPAFRGLAEAGRIVSIHSQEASLEDIFLRKTGRTLR
jgi:fluoroquinolone transport system ATP-binding protein